MFPWSQQRYTNMFVCLLSEQTNQKKKKKVDAWNTPKKPVKTRRVRENTQNPLSLKEKENKSVIMSMHV